MKTIKNNSLVVELHVPDFELVKEFYSKLGFRVVSEDQIGKSLGYLVLRLNNTFLNFYGGDERVFNHEFFKDFPEETKRGYEVEITVIVKDIKNYYSKVYPKIKKNVVQKLTLKRWGKKDFRIVDPFGFYLRFTESVDWLK